MNFVTNHNSVTTQNQKYPSKFPSFDYLTKLRFSDIWLNEGCYPASPAVCPTRHRCCGRAFLPLADFGVPLLSDTTIVSLS